MTQLDDKLMAMLAQLLRKLESYLPPDYGVMTWCYNRKGADLDVVSFASNEQSTTETLRIIRTATSQLIQRDAKAGELGEERHFEAPGAGLTSPSEQLVSSAAVSRHGAHERVRIWVRGGLAGELVVDHGDGERIATMVLMLEERT